MVKVNLTFRMPGDERRNPLCETKWQYDAGTRTVLFVISQEGVRVPRVLGISHYRAEEKTDKP